jgi:hypothetical protein
MDVRNVLPFQRNKDQDWEMQQRQVHQQKHEQQQKQVR